MHGSCKDGILERVLQPPLRRILSSKCAFVPVALGSLAKLRLRVRIRSSRFAIYPGADSALMVSALSLAANGIKASVTLAF